MRVCACVSVFLWKGRELLPEILRQTGRDDPSVSMAAPPLLPQDPSTAHIQLPADRPTHAEGRYSQISSKGE